MQQKAIYKFGLIVLLAVPGSRCSNESANSVNRNESKPSVQSKSTSEVESTKENSETSGWEPIERVHFTRGTLISFSSSGGYIQKIRIEADTNFPTDTDPVDNPDFPFPSGQEVEITLYNMIDQQLDRELVEGVMVIVDSFGAQVRGNETNVLLGNIICYEKNGVYFDLKNEPANYLFSNKIMLDEGTLSIDPAPIPKTTIKK